MRFIIVTTIFIFVPFIVFAQEPKQKKNSVDDVDGIKVIKISAKDERVVIKTPDKKLQMIKVGDKIGENTKVVEISRGRVVIEEVTDKGTETVIIRVENGKQTVERIRKAVEEQPQLHGSQSTEKTNTDKSTDGENADKQE